ncbi:MAG: MFS transporter [Tenericutes bacterium]|nr:MFS transporter [Mycoplasmatota bacterium]
MEKQHKIQISKFGMYGFLKNLRFFEPYLLYYLTIISGLTLLQVGFLYSIREIIIYIFEIPSGVIADRFGKKTELVFCFMFYILSFILFYLASSYFMFILAMVSFGLGEAFRSGTHKAMIMQYLDLNKIDAPKSKIYGQTRSMSMIGSMTMSLISVVFIIWLPEVRILFLLSIIPYLLDMLLIISYPKYMNERRDEAFKLKPFLKENYRAVKYSLTDKKVRSLLVQASTYQAAFKSIKDYIQPIIITLTSTVILFSAFSLEENLEIYIGVIYAVIFLFSSVASRHAHIVVKKFKNKTIINLMWLFTGFVMIFLSFFLSNIYIIFTSFLIFYIFLNIRRPLMVELVGEATDKTKRASVLSVESQLTSLFVAIFAPIIGFIADRNMKLLFILVGIVMVLIYLFTQIPNKKVID